MFACCQVALIDARIILSTVKNGGRTVGLPFFFFCRLLGKCNKVLRLQSLSTNTDIAYLSQHMQLRKTLFTVMWDIKQLYLIRDERGFI